MKGISAVLFSWRNLTRKQVSLFKDYRIFKRQDGSWGRPEEVYLDEPYMDTGLHAFFGVLSEMNGNDRQQLALTNSYRKGRISLNKFVSFRKNCGRTDQSCCHEATNPRCTQCILRSENTLIWPGHG